MEDKIWEQITRAAANKVAQFFKPKENLVIQDFIQTAKKDIPAIIKNFTKSGD